MFMDINEAKKTAQFNLLVYWALTEHLRRGKIIFENVTFLVSFYTWNQLKQLILIS